MSRDECASCDLFRSQNRLQIVLRLGSSAACFEDVRQRSQAVSQPLFRGLLHGLRIHQTGSGGFFLSFLIQ
jgi:hypothetical protein